MSERRPTIFLPGGQQVSWSVYPHLLEEIHRANCVVLRAQEGCSLYLIGGYVGEHRDASYDCVELYYVVSDWKQAQIFCVRLLFTPRCSVRVYPFAWLPPGLVLLELLALPTRYGRAFRTERFRPRLLPVDI